MLKLWKIEISFSIVIMRHLTRRWQTNPGTFLWNSSMLQKLSTATRMFDKMEPIKQPCFEKTLMWNQKFSKRGLQLSLAHSGWNSFAYQCLKQKKKFSQLRIHGGEISSAAMALKPPCTTRGFPSSILSFAYWLWTVGSLTRVNSKPYFEIKIKPQLQVWTYSYRKWMSYP